ncbi:hypothetical protein FAIPA1_500016 [Frankia sp. AiPs1]
MQGHLCLAVVLGQNRRDSGAAGALAEARRQPGGDHDPAAPGRTSGRMFSNHLGGNPGSGNRTHVRGNRTSFCARPWKHDRESGPPDFQTTRVEEFRATENGRERRQDRSFYTPLTGGFPTCRETPAELIGSNLIGADEHSASKIGDETRRGRQHYPQLGMPRRTSETDCGQNLDINQDPTYPMPRRHNHVP